MIFDKVATVRNEKKGGETMRSGLYMFRHGKRMSQADMAERIGCHRMTYVDIENGKRDGSLKFWKKLQDAFSIPDEKIWELMKID